VHQPVYGSASPVLGVAWSLEIEVRFYLLVPVLAWAVCRITAPLMRRLALVLLAATCLAVASITVAPYLSGLLFAPLFLAGWLVADLYVTGPAWCRVRSAWWDVVAGVGLLGTIYVCMDTGHVRMIFWGPVLIGALLFGSLLGRYTAGLLAHPALSALGAMSYSIYLIHYPLLVLWGRWGAHHPWAAHPVAIVAAVVGSFLLALVFYVCIERPCMDPGWPARLGARVRGRPGTTTEAREELVGSGVSA
jgi:peptidoglycan/LPS O-acetylase OafA/YrhL